MWGAPDATPGAHFLVAAFEDVALDDARRVLVAVDAAKHRPAWKRIIDEGILGEVRLDCAFAPGRPDRPAHWLVATRVKQLVRLRTLSMSSGEPAEVCTFLLPDDDGDSELFLSSGTTPELAHLAIVSFGSQAALVRLDSGEVAFRLDVGSPPRVEARVISHAVTTDIDGDGGPDLALAIEFESVKPLRYHGTVRWYSGKDGSFVREIDRTLRLEGIGHRMRMARNPDRDAALLLSRYHSIFGSTVLYVSSRTGKPIGQPVMSDEDLPGSGWDIVELPDVDGDGRPDVLVSTYSHGCQGHPNQRVQLFSWRSGKALWSRSRPMK